jgi:hypothetical protein
MEKNRIIKALIIGAITGLVYEFVVDPMITKPVEKKVEEIL